MIERKDGDLQLPHSSRDFKFQNFAFKSFPTFSLQIWRNFDAPRRADFFLTTIGARMFVNKREKIDE